MQKFRDDRQMDGYEKESRRRDELLHVNGVAYMPVIRRQAKKRVLFGVTQPAAENAFSHLYALLYPA